MESLLASEAVNWFHLVNLEININALKSVFSSSQYLYLEKCVLKK